MSRISTAVFVLAIRIVSAQETIHLASVSGRVSDASGAVVEGASITTRQTDTNVTNSAVTDREGRFRFTYLKVGPYEVTVRQTGFAETRRALTMSVGGVYDFWPNQATLPDHRSPQTLIGTKDRRPSMHE